MRAVLVFAGTTSGGLGAEWYRLALNEWGRVPGGFVPLFLDAAQPPAGVPGGYCVTLGASGAGTVAVQSLVEMERHRTRIGHAVEAAVSQAMGSVDPTLIVSHPAKESMLGIVVGGAGGSGTPLSIIAVDELLSAMQKLRVVRPRISVLHIGPEISTNDISRDPVARQQRHIEANSAQLLEWLYQRTIVPLDGPTHAPNSPGPRIVRIGIVDQANGTHSLTTNRALQLMLARSLFFQVFARAGLELSERETDHLGTRGDRVDAN